MSETELRYLRRLVDDARRQFHQLSPQEVRAYWRLRIFLDEIERQKHPSYAPTPAL